MKKYKSLILALIFVSLIAIVSAGYNAYYTYGIKPIDIPSKCYTVLQSSPYLGHQALSPFTENHELGYIKIDMKNSNFYTSQVSNTGSMRPTIPDGADVIFIKPTKDDLKVGDIISFYCNNKDILHRITNISGGLYTTKGDNNNADDVVSFNCSTRFENITGKMVGLVW